MVVLTMRFRLTPTQQGELTLNEFYMYCDAADEITKQEKKAQRG